MMLSKVLKILSDKDGFYDSSGTYQLFSDYCDSVTRSFDVDQGICSVYCKKGIVYKWKWQRFIRNFII